MKFISSKQNCQNQIWIAEFLAWWNLITKLIINFSLVIKLLCYLRILLFLASQREPDTSERQIFKCVCIGSWRHFSLKSISKCLQVNTDRQYSQGFSRAGNYLSFVEYYWGVAVKFQDTIVKHNTFIHWFFMLNYRKRVFGVRTITLEPQIFNLQYISSYK